MYKNLSKTKKVVLWTGSAVLVAGIIIGIIFGSFAIMMNTVSKRYSFESYSRAEGSGDRIHFLNVGSSDAILLESNGHFALVDAGEDNDNPRGFAGLEIKGYEEEVVRYLNKIAVKEGIVKLDFVIGTHAHSDHIGGFDTIFNEENIIVEKAYLKRYYEERITKHEVEKWDNLEVYNQMLGAAKSNDIEVVQDLKDVTLALGNFTVKLFNTDEAKADIKVGENENSLGVLVEKEGKRVFLAGDINYRDGDEKRLAKEVGKVDILKLGHHGLAGSTSSELIGGLKPKLTVVTSGGIPAFEVKYSVNIFGDAPIYSTVKNNGIVIDFNADWFKLCNNSCVK